MKREQVKKGQVYYDKMDGYVRVTGRIRDDMTVNTSSGWSYIDDLRPLTARERGEK